MFLSNVMPLDERSAINLLGTINTSHALHPDDVPPVRRRPMLAVQRQRVQGQRPLWPRPAACTPVGPWVHPVLAAQGLVDSAGTQVDAGFHATFWGMQAMFQAPFECINPERWVQVGARGSMWAPLAWQVAGPLQPWWASAPHAVHAARWAWLLWQFRPAQATPPPGRGSLRVCADGEQHADSAGALRQAALRGAGRLIPGGCGTPRTGGPSPPRCSLHCPPRQQGLEAGTCPGHGPGPALQLHPVSPGVHGCTLPAGCRARLCHRLGALASCASSCSTTRACAGAGELPEQRAAAEPADGGPRPAAHVPGSGPHSAARVPAPPQKCQGPAARQAGGPAGLARALHLTGTLSNLRAG